MSMEYEPGAMGADHGSRSLGVQQALAPLVRPGHRWVMNQDHPEKAQPPGGIEQAGKTKQLRLPQPARGQQRRGRHRRGQSDEGHRPAHPQAREPGGPAWGFKVGIGIHEGRPQTHSVFPGGVDQTVVIARDQTDLFSRCQPFQPSEGSAALGGKPEVGKVAGDGQVIRPGRPQIGHQATEHGGIVQEPASPPP